MASPMSIYVLMILEDKYNPNYSRDDGNLLNDLKTDASGTGFFESNF